MISIREMAGTGGAKSLQPGCWWSRSHKGVAGRTASRRQSHLDFVLAALTYWKASPALLIDFAFA